MTPDINFKSLTKVPLSIRTGSFKLYGNEISKACSNEIILHRCKSWYGDRKVSEICKFSVLDVIDFLKY